MVFASLRFDDAIHVKPHELILTDEGLFGVAWQTKVERKRRGTKFVVLHVGFADSGWLLAGWSIFQLESFDRDYWMRESEHPRRLQRCAGSLSTFSSMAPPPCQVRLEKVLPG